MAIKIDRDAVFQDVLEGLKEGIAWARGESDLRVTRIEIPDPPPSYSADQIKAIRGKSGMSQGLFSRYLSVSAKTLQAWEQGTRHPSPLSSRLLQMVELHPDILRLVPHGKR